MSHEPSDWRQRNKWLWAKTDGRCAYCGTRFASYAEMTDDHVVPRSRGGSHSRTNRLPCCRSCNAVKGPRPVAYLRDALQRRLHGRPAFTAEQMAYLEAAGFTFPAETRFEFYWEKLGYSLDEGANG